MKRLLTLTLFVLTLGAGYAIWPLLQRDPEVLAIGFTFGVLFGAVTGIPTALLVLAAQRRGDRRDDPAPAPSYRSAPTAVAYPMAAYPPNFVMPHGMQDTNLGSWHTNGAYDMSWGPPAVRD